MRRVVITGLGMVAPTGNNTEQAWQNAVDGQTGVRRINLFDPSQFTVQIAAEVKGFDPGTIMDPKEARRTSRFINFAVAAAKEALADSGLNYQNANTVEWGTAIGVGLGSLAGIADGAIELHKHGQKRISPFLIPYAIPNMAAGLVSRHFNLKGPNICCATACSSGTHAFGEAFMYIQQNLAEVMVAGGAESAICPLGIVSFANMKALSADNDCPERASRPFDRTRNGFVMGEGAGICVLEELEHAKKRGAKIYCEVVGYGLSADAYHITAPSPDGEGGQRCMEMALRTGKVAKEKVHYINAHGTSTKLNDQYESMAIMRIFGDYAPKISISSTKGVTGHCLGAAGGIEAVYTALAIYHSLIPPTANYQDPDPDCPLDYTVSGARERQIEYAMSNSFGFGGTNATIVLKRFVGYN